MEFGARDFDIPACDVLILAGDICTPWIDRFEESEREKMKEDFHEFFAHCAQQAGKVLYVMGNHEHYNGEFSHTAHKLHTEYLSKYPGKFELLNNRSVEIDGIVFWGSTFWTDFNKNDPQAIWDAKRGMNDFNLIYWEAGDGIYSYGIPRFLPEDAASENHYARSRLRECCTKAAEEGKEVIVITHHAPTFQSVHHNYSMDTLSYSYANTGLEEFIMDSPELVLWIHGHTHWKPSYRVGNCQVICHPRGYVKYEPDAAGYKPLVLDEL